MLSKIPPMAWIALILGCGAAFAWFWFGRTPTTFAQAPQAYSIITDDPEILTMGESVYAVACASCHGADFAGQENWRRPGADGMLPAPPHDRTGHTWHHSDEVLFNVVKFGPGYNVPGYRTRMQAYDGILSDEEIRAVNSFIAAQWPPEILNAQRKINTDWETAKASSN